jgi:hypothetical protein
VDFFSKATEWLADKAGAASIDWNALAAKGQDSVRNPAYMDQYLLPAFQRCSRVMDTLDLQRGTPAEVMSNYFELKDKLGDTAANLLESGVTVVTVIDPMFQPALLWSAYNNIVYYMWAMALTSANMHVTAQIHKSGIPDADIAYHASLTTMMFNVVSRMDDFGLLKPLKKKTTSGLGAIPIAVVIALGVVAIIAIAWSIVAIFEISQRNEVVKAACVKATESGDPVAIENCQKLFSTPEGTIAGQLPKSINDVVQKIAIAAMVGASVYMLVLFGPSIATKVKQTMASWNAA